MKSLVSVVLAIGLVGCATWKTQEDFNKESKTATDLIPLYSHTEENTLQLALCGAYVEEAARNSCFSEHFDKSTARINLLYTHADERTLRNDFIINREKYIGWVFDSVDEKRQEKVDREHPRNRAYASIYAYERIARFLHERGVANKSYQSYFSAKQQEADAWRGISNSLTGLSNQIQIQQLQNQQSKQQTDIYNLKQQNGR